MELTSTAELHQAAEEAEARGDALAQLRYAAEALRLEPDDHQSRLRVGRALAALDDKDAAIAIFLTAAEILSARGFFLAAIAACMNAHAIRPDPDIRVELDRLHQRIAGLEAAGRAHVPPPLPPRRLEDDADGLLKIEDRELLLERARKIASARPLTKGPAAEPTAVPLFSEISRESFASLIGVMGHLRFARGARVVTEGSLGSSLFLLVHGEVHVVRTRDGKETQLARLGEGSLFGEMALMTEQPRTASVVATEPSEFFEIDRTHIEAIAAREPKITEELVQFARRRLLNNVLSTSPIFRPFPRTQRLEMLRDFQSLVLQPGTVLIREGTTGTGLYVIASGEVEISKSDAQGDRLVLARLAEGEVFGEIALTQGTLTTATAVASAPKTVVLHIDRPHLERISAAHPEIGEYLASLSETRRREMRQALDASSEVLDADELVRV